VFVSAKSPESVPVRLGVIVRVCVGSVLLNVAVCTALVVPTAWLAKVKLPGTSSTNVPVPLSATVCGEPAALSLIDSVPLLAGGLDCLGVNVTVMVQLAPAETLVPQVFVSVNSLGSVVTLMPLPEKVSAIVPGLVKVTVCGVPDAPTTCRGNVRLVADRDTTAAPPVPVSGTV